MNELNQKMKTLNRLDLFFIITGLIEVFCFVFLTHNFYLMIVGIITIFTAYIALKKNKLKWNYFVGIWALVKYNPIGLALISFILSDFIGNSSGSIIIAFIIIGLVFIVAISSFVLGIIIIVKTVKYIKSQNRL